MARPIPSATFIAPMAPEAIMPHRIHRVIHYSK